MSAQKLPIEQAGALLKQRLIELEELTRGPVLLLSATMLDIEILPTLYETLQKSKPNTTLNVVLYGRGGDINSIRRIALLLRDNCQKLVFLVPHYCQSAFTALALAGDCILGGPLSIFSPIDTRLNLEENSEASCLQSEDVRLFSDMASDWFDIPANQRHDLLGGILNSIFPATLTNLYRSQLEMSDIAEQMLDLGIGKNFTKDERKRVVGKLMKGFHSHYYALTIADLADLNLPADIHNNIYDHSWKVAKVLQTSLGGAARATPEEPRCDAIIGFSNNLTSRLHFPRTIASKWHNISASEI